MSLLTSISRLTALGALTLALTACGQSHVNPASSALISQLGLTAPPQSAQTSTLPARPRAGAQNLVTTPVPGLMVPNDALEVLSLSDAQLGHLQTLSQTLNQASSTYRETVNRYLAGGSALEQALQQSFSADAFSSEELAPLFSEMLAEADPQYLTAQTDYLISAYASLSPEQRSWMIQIQQSLAAQRENQAFLAENFAQGDAPPLSSSEIAAQNLLLEQLLTQLNQPAIERVQIENLLGQLLFGQERQARLVTYLQELHTLLTPAQRTDWLSLLQEEPDRLQHSLGSELGMGRPGPAPLS